MDVLLDSFIVAGKEIAEKWVIVAKGYWCWVTKHKKEYWGVFDRTVQFFREKLADAEIFKWPL